MFLEKQALVQRKNHLECGVVWEGGARGKNMAYAFASLMGTLVNRFCYNDIEKICRFTIFSTLNIVLFTFIPRKMVPM